MSPIDIVINDDDERCNYDEEYADYMLNGRV